MQKGTFKYCTKCRVAQRTPRQTKRCKFCGTTKIKPY